MTKTEHWYDFIYEFLIRYYPSFPGVKMCLLAFSIASDILNEKKKHKHNSKKKKKKLVLFYNLYKLFTIICLTCMYTTYHPSCVMLTVKCKFYVSVGNMHTISGSFFGEHLKLIILKFDSS